MSTTKPILRGHLNRYIAKHVTIGVSLGIAVAIAFKYLYAEPKKQRYADFYKNYDPEADLRRMQKLGLMHAENPDDK